MLCPKITVSSSKSKFYVIDVSMDNKNLKHS